MATVTDAFCGAGGSSTGVKNAGLDVRMAINHWKRAIETHQTNHPETDHDLSDLMMAHPSQFPKTDILWMSPECTNHSIAKGKRRKGAAQMTLDGSSILSPEEIRSRATMREVVEFTEYHRYQIVIVENVVDIRNWEHYVDWFRSMENLGYEHKTLYLNAQFFGVPQSRDRWYTVFWRKGMKAPDLDFRPAAQCEEHGLINAVQSWKHNEKRWGRYGVKNGQYVYRCPVCAKIVHPYTSPSSSIIDWSIPAQRIGDRKTPLKPKTMQRIEAGLRKFADRAVLVNLGHKGDSSSRTYSTNAPMPTQTSRQELAVSIRPFVTTLRQSVNYRELGDPLTTVTGGGNNHSLVISPFIMSLNHSTDRNTSTADVMPTVMTRVVPSLVTPPFVIADYSNAVIKPVTDPLSTIPTVNKHMLITPDEAASLVDDCLFRMLEPDELKRAQSFPPDYIVLGSKKDQVKQVGNAVACNVAEWIARRCLEALESA